MAKQIPVNLKYKNATTLENDHLLPTTKADLVEETPEKQFISQSLKNKINQKQDALGYTPINKAGDTMTGPLVLSAGAIVQDRQAATKQYVDQKVAALVNGAPDALDTIYELAAAINNDPNFAVSLSTMTGTKLDKSEVSVIAEPNKVLYLNNDGELDANATSATRFQAPFSFRLSGAVTMEPVEIDGSRNIEGVVTINILEEEDVDYIFNHA